MTDAAHRQNNFDTIRLVASLMVVLSHSIPLSYGPNDNDILYSFSHAQATFGYLAVQIFFVISGFLITGSYTNTKDPVRFIRARILRLVPALLVVLWLVTFILGPLVTTVPLGAYFQSSLPWRAAFGMSDHLPGVFTNNPFSAGIDGSLWTLRYEALCYFGILLLGLCGLLNRAILTVLFLIDLALRFHFGARPIFDLSCLFAAGAVLNVWRPSFSLTFAVPAAILWGISLSFSGYALISYTAGAYVILFIGLSPELKLPNLAKYGDLSYGVYIYTWPIQQTISLLMRGHTNWIVNSLISLPLALGLAWLSWHAIEAPALSLKNRKILTFI